MATTSAEVVSTESSQPFIPSSKTSSKTKAKFTINPYEEDPSDSRRSKKLKSKWLILVLLLVFFLIIIFGLVFFVRLLPGCGLFKNKPLNEWWKKEIMYQVEVSMFKDSNSDGIGDINGLRLKLDYINSLGAKTVIISRLNSKETVKGIDSVYGDNESLTELRKELDQKGQFLS